MLQIVRRNMKDELERLRKENERQYEALMYLNDEVMSILHAHALRQDTIASNTVIEWLRGIYNTVQEGLGKPAVFEKETNREGQSTAG